MRLLEDHLQAHGAFAAMYAHVTGVMMADEGGTRWGCVRRTPR